MTDKRKTLLWRFIKYFLMLGVPLIVVIVKWGFVAPPTNDSPSGKWALGFFIAIILVGQFVVDVIKHQIEQYKLSKRISFMRNHTLTYIVVGVLMFIAHFIAWDAMIFCAWAGGSSLIAYGAAALEVHYYAKWKGLE